MRSEVDGAGLDGLVDDGVSTSRREQHRLGEQLSFGLVIGVVSSLLGVAGGEA